MPKTSAAEQKLHAAHVFWCGAWLRLFAVETDVLAYSPILARVIREA